MIPSDWSIVKCGDIFNRRTEKGNSICLRYLTCGITSGVLYQDDFNGATKLKENTDLNEMRTIHKNDFIMMLRSFQGGFVLSDLEGVSSTAYKVFYAKNLNKVYPRFFKYVFKSDAFIHLCGSLSTGAATQSISFKTFQNVGIMLPPLKEQQAIADYLDTQCTKIDAQINYYTDLISELRQYKQATISEYVTGK